jgi:two-component system, OmpR family, response regulator VicR
MKAHLLYVEDDESLSFVTKDNLELLGYKITYCEDGNKAMEVINSKDFKYDLCILDVMLPGVDGFTLATNIRRFNNEVPIIFLTAKSLKEDKIHGLKLGADDYLTKPFSIEELILKIEIFLKRSTFGVKRLPDITQVGEYEFDYKNLQLKHTLETKNLTQKEADLLKMFLENKNLVIKRSEILIKLWGNDDYFLGRSLDVFISRLRKCFQHDERIKIDNIHSVGFKMSYE